MLDLLYDTSRQLLLAGLVLVGVVLYFTNAFQRWRFRHIPGPPPVFPLGNLSEMRSKKAFQAYSDWADKYGPVVLLWFVRRPFVLITDAALARQVMVKNFSSFHDRGNFTRNATLLSKKRAAAIQSGLLPATGAYWASLRAAMQPLFHTASLESYAPIINEAVTQLLGNLEHVAKQQEEVDLWRQFGRLTMQIIGRSAFGVEFESQRPAGEPDPPLVDAAQQVFNNTQANIWELCVMILPQPVSWVLGPVLKLMNKLLPPKGQAQLEKAFLMLWNTSTALVENAQAQLSPDQPSKDSSWKWFKDDPENLYRAKGTAPAENSVIGMLMKARNKQTDMNFSDMQVAAQSNTFILAGYETTANTLAFCVYLLCKHPEAQQKLIAEVDAFGKDREPTLADLEQLPYTSAVVNEALRVYPPATFVTREARQDVVVGGYHLPKGTWVHLNIWHMHHNEQYFTDAQKFKPERWLGNREGVKEPNAYMPFGSGPRMCIAFKLALEEAIIALARLYQRYTFELGQELQKQDQLEIRSGITIAPKIGLPVKVLLRE